MKMPKKTATARSAAQRNKPRVQKSIELVRQPKETPAERSAEPAAVSVSTTAAAAPVSTVETPTTKGTSASKETPPSKAESPVGVTNSAPKGSASERLAARRQGTQKQRTAVNLISAEHYSYVRKDLIFIAILAAIMFSVIIILHFVPAIGG
jgi:hypothetical protein